VPELEAMFDSRGLTPEFLHLWGVFRSCCGFIESSLYAQGNDLGSIRAGRAGGRPRLDPQKKWVAHLLTRQLDAGRLGKLAERDVAKAILLYISTEQLPDAFPKEWFSRILGADNQLKLTYSSKHLNSEQIQQLLDAPIDDIPLTDIHIPKT
jgi:hypothetical protein